MSIADRVVVVPQREYNELNAEIAKLRAALKIARKWMPTTIAAAYTIQGAEEVRIVDALLANEQEGK
jgi:hypothetical protein